MSGSKLKCQLLGPGREVIKQNISGSEENQTITLENIASVLGWPRRSAGVLDKRGENLIVKPQDFLKTSIQL